MSASPRLVPKVPPFVVPKSLSERDLSSPSSTVFSIASFTGHVETTVQALHLIHAAHQGIIPRIARQLNDPERKTIRSGTILVISADESGINQWTDGLLWSPPQVVGNFLMYRQIEDDFHGGQELFKPGALIKKSITVTIEGSDLQLISYYVPEDIYSGKLKLPTSRPDIMNLDMPLHIFNLANFRLPPSVKIGSDGKPYIVDSESPNELEVEDPWVWNSDRILPTSTQMPKSRPGNLVGGTNTNPFHNMKLAGESRWPMKGDPLPSTPLRGAEASCSLIFSADSNDHTPQATADTFSPPRFLEKSDRGTQSACHRQDAGKTLDELHSKAPKDRRRRSRKSRSAKEYLEMKGGSEYGTEAGSIANGIFANQPNMNPFIPNTLASAVPSCPVAYYPPPAFMVMMPLPFIPFVPMFGPSQWTNINSGNVNNVHMYDAANNNSTNLDIRKVYGKEKKGRRGRQK